MIDPRRMVKIIATGMPGVSVFHLCNRETFLFDPDHQRYEAHLSEGLQVQQTISGFNTWASNVGVDAHNKHRQRSHAIHSSYYIY